MKDQSSANVLNKRKRISILASNEFPNLIGYPTAMDGGSADYDWINHLPATFPAYATNKKPEFPAKAGIQRLYKRKRIPSVGDR